MVTMTCSRIESDAHWRACCESPLGRALNVDGVRWYAGQRLEKHSPRAGEYVYMVTRCEKPRIVHDLFRRGDVVPFEAWAVEVLRQIDRRREFATGDQVVVLDGDLTGRAGIVARRHKSGPVVVSIDSYECFYYPEDLAHTGTSGPVINAQPVTTTWTVVISDDPPAEKDGR